MILVATAMAAPLSLTYAEALQRALSGSPELAAADARVTAASGDLLTAMAPYEPKLRANAQAWERQEADLAPFGPWSGDTGGWSSSLSLSQALATGTTLGVDLAVGRTRYAYHLSALDADITGDPLYRSRLVLRLSQRLLDGNRLAGNLEEIKLARGARARAEVERQAARQAVLAEAGEAWWTVWTLAEEQAALQALIAALSAESGQPRVRAALAWAAREEALLAARRADAADRLRRAIGEGPGDVEVVGALTLAAPSIEAVVARVRGNNAEILSAHLAVDDATDALGAARQAMLPALDLDAAYELGAQETSVSAAFGGLGDGDLRGGMVGLSLEVPLFNRADRGALGAAEGRLAEAEARLRAVEAERVAAVTSEVRTVEAGVRAAELAGEEIAAWDAALEAEPGGVELLIARSEAARAAARARGEAGRAMVRVREIEGSIDVY